MDKEEILRNAKEKYPVGCKVLSEYAKQKKYNNITIVETQDFRWSDDNLKVNGNKFSPFLLWEGVWAEIISSPIRTYELW